MVFSPSLENAISDRTDVSNYILSTIPKGSIDWQFGFHPSRSAELNLLSYFGFLSSTLEGRWCGSLLVYRLFKRVWQGKLCCPVIKTREVRGSRYCIGPHCFKISINISSCFVYSNFLCFVDDFKTFSRTSSA